MWMSRESNNRNRPSQDHSARTSYYYCAVSPVWRPAGGICSPRYFRGLREYSEIKVRAESQALRINLGHYPAGTCGMALGKRQRVIVPDVEECPAMAGTEDLATFRQPGIRSC